MIRGITYDKQLFKSSDFSLMTKRFFNGNDGIVEGCELSKSGSNIIIGTGWFVASGYYTNVETQQTIAMSNGKLVYEIDLTKTNTTESFNQGSFKIITGTPRQDDLFNGGTIYQMPIATIDGTSYTKVWGNAVTDIEDYYARTEKLEGSILFEGEKSLTTGGTSKITLADNVSNYRYIEIYYYRNANGRTNPVKYILQESKKIDTSVDYSIVSLSGVYAMGDTFGVDTDNQYRLLHYSQKISINGTEIKLDSQVTGGIYYDVSNSNYKAVFSPGVDLSIYITKVIGYK